MSKITNEMFYYLMSSAKKHNARFLRCGDVLYEVRKTHYPTGNSPLWDFEEVRPVVIPAFVPEPGYNDA